MKFIKRWALMRNTYPESIQEHSQRVAVIAHALAHDSQSPARRTRRRRAHRAAGAATTRAKC
jgi:5'-deoxynucleotidase YfbR-like HD superfamily hydrolase